MSTTEGGGPAGAAGGQPSEEELRAAYEAEIKKIRVEHVLLEHVVTLINLGMRRTGLAPGTEPERDPEQVRLAVEGVRAVLPLVEQVAPDQAGPIRDALSQLQLAFVRIGGEASGTGEPTAPPPGEPSGTGGAGAGEPGGDQAPTGAPGQAEPAPSPEGDPSEPGQPGPAQRSGRLWVPGQ